MGIISNDADEGLITSLLMYVGALAVTVLVLGTPVYLLNMPRQIENHGVAAYEAPRGTRLLPEVNRRNVAQDLSIATRVNATRPAPR